jgi:hypothetical protein
MIGTAYGLVTATTRGDGDCVTDGPRGHGGADHRWANRINRLADRLVIPLATLRVLNAAGQRGDEGADMPPGRR